MKPKTLRIYLISIFLLITFTTVTSHAVEVTCFSKDYTREKGKPVSIPDDFYSAHEGTGTVKVTTNAKVTGATITLNGEVLWTPKHFKERITYYEKEATLHQNNNTIEVYDESKPGACLQVEITQELAEGESHIKPLDMTSVVVDPYTGLQLVSNQIVVMFKEGVSINTVTAIINSIDGLIIGYMPDLNVYQVEITTNPSVEQLKVLIEQLNNDENVETAIKNGINQLSKIPDPNKDPEWGIDSWDESYPDGQNWGLEAIFAPSAWDYALGGSDIKVGIVDGGFNIIHEDIEVEPNHATGALNQIISYDMTWDSCGNEYKAVLFNNHGTHVAGIIGAESNDEDGITGIMWEKNLYVYRTDFQDADIYFGIIKLLRQGVKVINLSIGKFHGWANCQPCAISGSGCPSDNNPDDVNDLNNKKKFSTDVMKIWMQKYGDFLIVQAAGNDGIDAKWSGFFAPVDDLEVKSRILVVASIDRPSGCPSNCSYSLSSFSNIGSQVDIAAPGESIFSTIYYSPYYDEYSGTSMAAPHVTGVAGLVWNANPNLSAAEVRQILKDTADRPFTEDGFEYRILNAYEAVKSVLEPEYTITDLGTLGGDYSNAIAINASGQVVGNSVTEDWYTGAFLWENNIMTDLGHLGNFGSIARDINDSNQVVGDSLITGYDSTYGRHAFLWQNGVMTDLGTLGGSEPLIGDPTMFWEESIGYDNNNLGQIVGTSISPDTDSHAFLITPEDTNGDSVPDLWFRDDNSDGANDLMVDLGTLGGSDMDGLAASSANGINDMGQVVGVSATPLGERHAVLWQNGVMTDLGTLGGTLCSAFYINMSGLVVGGSTISISSDYNAFLLTPEDTNGDSVPDLWFRDNNSDGANDLMVDLGTLGGSYSFARNVNASGQVVGDSSIGGDVAYHAFLWENDVMWDLNDLIPAGSGWELEIARDINDAGQIVGYGIIDDEYRGFLLTPIP